MKITDNFRVTLKACHFLPMLNKHTVMKADGVTIMNTILRARDIYVGEAHTHLLYTSSCFSGLLLKFCIEALTANVISSLAFLLI